ncbi:M20 family metallopeptidase [Brucella pituitosa]|uniref:M20 family metallopeptidase n=1 Tax=Brucella pituitosa TaxID=571256 RepID=A0ABS3K465_9HYPH|nr:M20 family metallopeptidase [Brucella pituitosa]MBO1041165.1 M20 family metallopeptidase [Brucella pituitosa]
MTFLDHHKLASVIIDRIDPARVTRDLSELITIRSVNPFDDAPSPGCREEELAEIYLAKMQAIRLETGRVDVVDGRPNIWGRLKGKGQGPVVMLAGHMDTVGTDGYPDAFSGRIENGLVYGRGACDMKAALAAFLEVARAIRESAVELPGDLLLVGLCDEEHMMLGSKDFGRTGPKADFAIVGEPTSLRICPAHSGQRTFFIRTYGTAVHSSRPERGVNAIVHMARVINALEGYGENLKRAQHHPLCGYGRFSPGVIRGGSISSAVPDFCELEIDRRFLPGETSEQIVAELRARIDPLAASDNSFRYEIVGPALDVAALDTPVGSPIVLSLVNAATHLFGSPPEIDAFPGGTDAPNLDCPAVVCGPGDLAQAHTLDEYVEVDQVVKAVQLYIHAIVDLMETRT